MSGKTAFEEFIEWPHREASSQIKHDLNFVLSSVKKIAEMNGHLPRIQDIDAHIQKWPAMHKRDIVFCVSFILKHPEMRERGVGIREAYPMALRIASLPKSTQIAIVTGDIGPPRAPNQVPPPPATRPPPPPAKRPRLNTNQQSNMTPRKQLERDLGIDARPSITSVKIIKGERFKEWLKMDKFDALLENLGMNRPDVNGAPFCSGMIDGMKTWLKSIKKGVDRWISKMRYAVIVYRKEHAVSALFCTIDGHASNIPVVTIEYICTNKGHGVPLMKYAELDANLRTSSHITLHSMIHAIPFYAKLGYRRGPNACDAPLTRKERDDAHVAWKKFVAKYKKREIARGKDLENAKKSLDEARLALDTAMQGGKEKTIKKMTYTNAVRQARVDKIAWELGVLEERLSRFSNPDDWRGKRRDGTFMYDVPVLFTNDEKYPLPVFSKCILTNDDKIKHRSKKTKSGLVKRR